MSHAPSVRDARPADAAAICLIYNQGIEDRVATLERASLNPFSARRAYDTVADLSIYVERGWRGKGVGRVLLAETIARATNAPAEALYARSGFSRVGVYREQGLLDGRWTDVLVMERLL